MTTQYRFIGRSARLRGEPASEPADYVHGAVSLDEHVDAGEPLRPGSGIEPPVEVWP